MFNKTIRETMQLSNVLPYIFTSNLTAGFPSFPLTLVLCVKPHLVWRSLEDAGALVDRLGPQADIFVLQLLGRAVHRLGNQAAFWYLTLQRKGMCADKETHTQNWVSKGDLNVGGALSQKTLIRNQIILSNDNFTFQYSSFSVFRKEKKSNCDCQMITLNLHQTLTIHSPPRKSGMISLSI